MKRLVLLLAMMFLITSGAWTYAAEKDLAADVRASERAFAKTMADRDHSSFGQYVSEEAVFFGRSGPLRGRAAVIQSWKRFFEGQEAPFSWEPETVEVLPSGTLALTSGPVRDPKGTLIGTFQSIWRFESDGKWRLVFDKGCPVCEPEKKP
jgi:ketosteroid isomerase-like protein